MILGALSYVFLGLAVVDVEKCGRPQSLVSMLTHTGCSRGPVAGTSHVLVVQPPAW